MVKANSKAPIQDADSVKTNSTRAAVKGNNFTVAEVMGWKTPGTFCDIPRSGLYLRVEWRMSNGKPTAGVENIAAWKADPCPENIRWTKDDVTKTWVFRYWQRAAGGKRVLREMGLGTVLDLGLVEVREVARDQRNLLRKFKDPIGERKAARERVIADRKKQIPLETAAQLYWHQHRGDFKSDKDADQWINPLKNHVFPKIGKVDVSTLTRDHMLQVLRPIWKDKAETASRIRSRIEKVLDWCKVERGLTGDNVAAWRGNLEHGLGKSPRKQDQEHHAALAFRDIGAFMVDLSQREAVAARALEFLILTATRTSEVLFAKWDEFDMDHQLWTIPKERMKAGKEHFVTLSPSALEIIKTMEKTKTNDYVFPGGSKTGALSNMAMHNLLERMDRGDITVHGFRATFRTWAGEKSGHAREVIENALAHQLKDKTEASYNRGTQIAKRRPLLDDWALYCSTVKTDKDNVIPMRSAL